MEGVGSGVRHAPLSNVKSRDKEMRSCCHTAVRSSRGCGLPDQGSPSTALQHQALRQLFTAWVRLLVLRDTVALFGISIDFGGIFFFFKNLPLRQIPSASIHWLVSLVEKGS